MTQEPQKSNVVLIVIAIIGVVGTIVATTIGAIGNYNIEKLRQDTELTRIALVLIATQGGATQASLASTISAPTDISTPPPAASPNIIVSPLPSLTFTPALFPNVTGQEIFPNFTIRPVSLKSGELLVGTAVKFAILDYGCNTMDITENIPYTVFLIRGPIDVEIQIYNGGWDYWVNMDDDNFAQSLLEPKINEVKQHPNYPTVRHVECIVPPFK
jgi:hypothetical protein